MHGRGTFATAEIAAGDVVTIWEHRILDSAHGAPRGGLWPRPDGTFVWVPPNDPAAAEAFINHACEPNVWMSDEVTLAARRPIAPGEELTIDYALFELDRGWTARWRCRCGTARCRGSITGRDYELPHLRHRYAGHFHPMVAKRLEK